MCSVGNMLGERASCMIYYGAHLSSLQATKTRRPFQPKGLTLSWDSLQIYMIIPKSLISQKKSQNSKSGPIRGNDSQIIFHMVFQFVYCYDFPTNCTMYYRNLSFSISFFFGTLSGWNGCTLFHFPFLRLDLYQITFTLSFGIDVPSHTRGYCCIA